MELLLSTPKEIERYLHREYSSEMKNDRRQLLDWEKAECAALKAELASYNARAAKGKKLTQEDIALSVGMSQGTLSSHLNGNRALNKEMAAEIAKILGIPVERFSPRIAKEISELAIAANPVPATEPLESNVEPGPPITSAPRRIDIVGTAQLGHDGYWLSLDQAAGWVETYSRDEDAYALRLKGDSMAPAIRSGWIAICEPNHRLVPGEYVLITTTDGQSMVKELLFETDEDVSLMSINTAYGERLTIARPDIENIHYVGAILAPSKVLGRI
jgi:phage repressor protein C with HTH and peptisase S24 domain